MLILPFKLIEVFPQVKRKCTNPKKHFRANIRNIVGDKSHSTRSKEEIQKSNKVQTDKNNDHIRSLRRYQIRSLRRYQIRSLRRYPIRSLVKD